MIERLLGRADEVIEWSDSFLRRMSPEVTLRDQSGWALAKPSQGRYRSAASPGSSKGDSGGKTVIGAAQATS
jgi:hypothetical protein